MPSVETIYKNTILPLPPHERLRLAKIIVEQESIQESAEQLSGLSIIEGLNGARVFGDAAEVDKYLAKERDSWDN
ncbi:MAG: hypothetical protein IPM21_04155 [Acidobacteria bacterium]|nr:hypothetical protein [Acidobacteriota bacterium]